MGAPIIFSGNNAKLLKTNLDFGVNSLTKTGNFSSANNSGAADVTGLIFTPSTDRGGKVLLSVFIDATSDLAAEFTLDVIQKAASFEISSEYLGDSSGIVFSITSGGQVQYTSTNETGFSSGLFRWTQIINKL